VGFIPCDGMGSKRKDVCVLLLTTAYIIIHDNGMKSFLLPTPSKILITLLLSTIYLLPELFPNFFGLRLSALCLPILPNQVPETIPHIIDVFLKALIDDYRNECHELSDFAAKAVDVGVVLHKVLVVSICYLVACAICSLFSYAIKLWFPKT